MRANPVRDRIAPAPSDPSDPLGLIRDAVNVTHAKAMVEGDKTVRVAALMILASIAKIRKQVGLPALRQQHRSGRA